MDFLWRKRSYEPEWMDQHPLTPDDAARVLGALEKVNFWLGGVQATLSHIKRFAKYWQPGERIRLIDWGTGGADIPRALVRWGRAHGFKLEVVGVDSNPAVLDYAREACRDYPEISFLHSDLAKVNDDSFDYALSSMCLHHLTDAQIVNLLQKSHRLCKRGMIMNDLRRSPIAWAWIWLITRISRAHPMVQHDAPLSVRRAFRPRELQRLALQAGLTYLNVESHFGYRLALAGEKIGSPAFPRLKIEGQRIVGLRYV